MSPPAAELLGNDPLLIHRQVESRRSDSAVHNSFAESGLKQTKFGKSAQRIALNVVHLSMKTAAEYRTMAEECFKWAREARDDDVRAPLLQLAQVWPDAASKLDGLPANRSAAAPDDSPKTAA
jgi:hypothetical protein